MSRSKKLYNSDLAPTPSKKKNWGWFEIFNVWANDVQSLFGYTLAASLFLASGLNGWAVFLALILAGFFIIKSPTLAWQLNITFFLILPFFFASIIKSHKSIMCLKPCVDPSQNASSLNKKTLGSYLSQCIWIKSKICFVQWTLDAKNHQWIERLSNQDC